MKKIKFVGQLLKDTAMEWAGSPAMKESAAMAYFAIFSIPGLLIIVSWVAGIFFGDEAVNGQISENISNFMGPEIAQNVQSMVASAVVNNDNILMKIIGIGTLVFGATTLFFQMQRTLNQLWGVEAAPKKAWKRYLLDRANSLGMILIIGFLLLVSLVLTSLINLANNWFTHYFGLETFVAMRIIYFVFSFCIIWVLFALMFKVLPDVEIQWKSVGMGAFVAALLFSIGKFILAYYFEVSHPTSIFGAAGSVILLMLWINYSCQLIFFGAEFTKIFALKMGHHISPSAHAKWLASDKVADA